MKSARLTLLALVLIAAGACSAQVAGNAAPGTPAASPSTSGSSLDGAPSPSAVPSNNSTSDPLASPSVTAEVRTPESVPVSQTASPSSDDATSTTNTADRQWLLPDPVRMPPQNQFGDIRAELGRSYGITMSKPGEPSAEMVFLVSRMMVDPECADPTVKPKNGHFLALVIKIEPRHVTPEQIATWYGVFSYQAWTAFDSKGNAQPLADSDPAEACHIDYQPQYGTNEELLRHRVSGDIVVLDVNDESGTLLLDAGTDQKWEYHYPG